MSLLLLKIKHLQGPEIKYNIGYILQMQKQNTENMKGRYGRALPDSDIMWIMFEKDTTEDKHLFPRIVRKDGWVYGLGISRLFKNTFEKSRQSVPTLSSLAHWLVIWILKSFECLEN